MTETDDNGDGQVFQRLRCPECESGIDVEIPSVDLDDLSVFCPNCTRKFREV